MRISVSDGTPVIPLRGVFVGTIVRCDISAVAVVASDKRFTGVAKILGGLQCGTVCRLALVVSHRE